MCENGASSVICCPGLFSGELIVTNSNSHRIITIAMNASFPDTEFAVSVFYELVRASFSQCILILILNNDIILFIIYFDIV